MKRFEINSSLQSIDPSETSFGYSYWSYMIPPFKPESILILGYGEGTIAALIKKVWGKDIRVTGVDLKKPENQESIDELLVGHAGAVVCDYLTENKNPKKFDYVVVDISNGSEHPEWIFSKEFVKDLARITKKLLSINVLGKARDMSFYDNYFDFDLEKVILDNKIYFYKAKENKDNYFL